MSGLCECGCGQPTTIAARNFYYEGALKGKPRRFVRGHNSRLSGHHELLKEHREQFAQAARERLGSLHPLWTGDEVSYKALHRWVNRHKEKTGKCAVCPHEGYTEFANISGLYFRDVNDFVEMCVPCHREFDYA